MADSKVSALDTLGSIDRTADYLYVVDATGPTSNKMTVNGVLGFSGGNPVSTSDTQTLTNKTLTTPTLTILDNALTIQDNSDTTKQLQLQLSGISTGTIRTITVPDASTTLVGTDTTQTLTNKTLTSPTINTATIANPTLTVNTVSEYTAANGVTVDGLLIKDGLLPAGNIQPLNLVSGTGSSWAWQTWSPTWTNLTVGNGTVTARYTQVGKTVVYRLGFVLGSTSAVASGPTFSLPVTATSYSGTATLQQIGGMRVFDTSGSASVIGAAYFSTTTTAVLQAWLASGTYVSQSTINSTTPFTWATGDEVYITGCYEAA